MDNLQASAQRQLRQFIEQIEYLEEQKKALVDDINEKYAEAKATGFCPKTMKRIVKTRKLTQAERDEAEALYETYARACGLLGLPLQDYADRADNVVSLERAEA